MQFPYFLLILHQGTDRNGIHDSHVSVDSIEFVLCPFTTNSRLRSLVSQTEIRTLSVPNRIVYLENLGSSGSSSSLLIWYIRYNYLPAATPNINTLVFICNTVNTFIVFIGRVDFTVAVFFPILLSRKIPKTVDYSF